MACDLRGFLACNVLQVRLGENPCAALTIKKNPQLLIGKYISKKHEKISSNYYIACNAVGSDRC